MRSRKCRIPYDSESLVVWLLLIPDVCSQCWKISAERFAFRTSLGWEADLLQSWLNKLHAFSAEDLALWARFFTTLFHKPGRRHVSPALLKTDFCVQVGSCFSQIFHHACALFTVHDKASKQKLYSSARPLSIKILSEPCILQWVAVSALHWKYESKSKISPHFKY